MLSLDNLIVEIKSEFPNFQIIPKANSKCMKFIGFLLTVISFGTSKDFMANYATTVGHTTFTPNNWVSTPDDSKIILLRHERIHMRQQQKYGRALFSFLYLAAYFPIVFAFWRTKFEKEAYTETIRAELELRGTARVWSAAYHNWLVSQFTGPAYLWMCPFSNSIHGWVRETIDKCVEEYVGYVPKTK